MVGLVLLLIFWLSFFINSFKKFIFGISELFIILYVYLVIVNYFVDICCGLGVVLGIGSILINE